MSFLTSFPEDAYPTAPLAPVIQGDARSIEAARGFMWLAQAAYETTDDSGVAAARDKPSRILGRWGFTVREWLSQGGTEGFVAESADALVVAFAGTDPVVAANWITDFDIRTATGGVHRGFALGVEGVWSPLVAALAGTAKPVFLVGHSLGGALATVAAWRLAGGAIGPGRIAGVFGFGMPRAGDSAFADSYRARGLWRHTVHFRYGSDVVPTLPPEAPGLLGFRHVGQGVHCAPGGRFVAPLRADDAPTAAHETTAREERGAAGRMQAAWRRLIDHGAPHFPAGGAASVLAHRLPYFLRDHLQDRYLEALGCSFARPDAGHPTLRAEDGEAFLRALKAQVDARFGSLARLLRGERSGT